MSLGSIFSCATIQSEVVGFPLVLQKNKQGGAEPPGKQSITGQQVSVDHVVLAT
jgi:hypothetical protein